MIVQLRDRHDEFTARGAHVVVVGLGLIDEADRFKDKHRIPFPLLVDTTKKSYRAMNLRRPGWTRVLGPEVWGRGIKSVTKRGIGLPKQDARQLGGAAVIGADGEVRYLYRAKSSADNPPIDELLSHL